MDISFVSQTPTSLHFPGANYNHEIVDSDEQGKTAYIALAEQLVNKWLNQALNYFEFRVGKMYQSNSCSPECENEHGSCNNNERSTSSGDVVHNSPPSLKRLCRETLRMLSMSNHAITLPVAELFDEGRELQSKCMNGMNGKSTSCNLLVTNVPHEQFCAVFTEFNGNMHIGEITEFAHSRGFVVRHAKSETLLRCSMKELCSVESDHRGSHSKHFSSSNLLRVCDFSGLKNILTANTIRAELGAEKCVPEGKFVQNIADDEIISHIQPPVGQKLPTGILNITTAVKDMTSGSTADENANYDYTSAHRHGLAIGILDPQENFACKVTNSSCDSVLSQDTDNSSHIFLLGPGVQVSSHLLHLLPSEMRDIDL